MRHLAPCGHEGTPIIGTYVMCPMCDKPKPKVDKPSAPPTWNVLSTSKPSLTFMVVPLSDYGVFIDRPHLVTFTQATPGKLIWQGGMQFCSDRRVMWSKLQFYQNGIESFSMDPMYFGFSPSPYPLLAGQLMDFTSFTVLVTP